LSEARNVGDRDVERLHSRRINADLISRCTPPTRSNRPTPAPRARSATVVGEPRERFLVHRAALDRVGQDRPAVADRDLADFGLLEVGWQVAAHAIHGVLHVEQRVRQVPVEREVGQDVDLAVRDVRDQVLQAVERRDRVLDFAGNLGLELRRRRAGNRSTTSRPQFEVGGSSGRGARGSPEPRKREQQEQQDAGIGLGSTRLQRSSSACESPAALPDAIETRPSFRSRHRARRCAHRPSCPARFDLIADTTPGRDGTCLTRLPSTANT
jgi:hypothetical protein